MITLTPPTLQGNDSIIFKTSSHDTEISLSILLKHSINFMDFYDKNSNSILIDITKEIDNIDDEGNIFNSFVNLLKGNPTEISRNYILPLERIFFKYQCTKLFIFLGELIVTDKTIEPYIVSRSLIFRIKNKQPITFLLHIKEESRIQKIISDVVNEIIRTILTNKITCDILSTFLDNFSKYMTIEQLLELMDAYVSHYGFESFVLLQHLSIDEVSYSSSFADDDEKEKLFLPFRKFIPLFQGTLKTPMKPKKVETQTQNEVPFERTEIVMDSPEKESISPIKTTKQPLDKMISVVMEKPRDYTPDIFDAILRGSLDCVKYLLYEDSSRLTLQDKNGNTPLHYAAKCSQYPITKYLLEHGADITAKNSKGYTPLHISASTTNADIVELLLKAGSNPNEKGKDDWTPMHDAAMLGTPRIVLCLLKNGGDVNAQDANGTTPLSVSGDEDISKILKQYGGHE